jgi:hypothetical protein
VFLQDGEANRFVLLQLAHFFEAPIVAGMITSTIHVLILVPIVFMMMKQRTISKNTNKEIS